MILTKEKFLTYLVMKKQKSILACWKVMQVWDSNEITVYNYFFNCALKLSSNSMSHACTVAEALNRVYAKDTD